MTPKHIRKIQLILDPTSYSFKIIAKYMGIQNVVFYIGYVHNATMKCVFD